MTAQASVSPERALQVNERVAAQLFQVGAIERLSQEIERDLLRAVRRHGETTTVHGDAVARSGQRSEARRRDFQLHSVVGRADP